MLDYRSRYIQQMYSVNINEMDHIYHSENVDDHNYVTQLTEHPTRIAALTSSIYTHSSSNNVNLHA